MYEIVKFDGRGKALQLLFSESLAMSKLFCLQNTTGKGKTVVYDLYTRKVVYSTKGTGRNCFPIVTFDASIPTMEEWNKKMGPDKVVRGRTH